MIITFDKLCFKLFPHSSTRIEVAGDVYNFRICDLCHTKHISIDILYEIEEKFIWHWNLVGQGKPTVTKERFNLLVMSC